jgi:hypothetical protein
MTMSEPLSDEVEEKLRALLYPINHLELTRSEARAAAAAYRLGLAQRSEPADYALWRAERAESAAAQRRHDEDMKFADDSGRKLAARETTMRNDPLRFRPGGLMRCCVATLEDAHAGGSLPTEPGSTLSCKHHREKQPDMTLDANGEWRWNREYFFPVKGE